MTFQVLRTTSTRLMSFINCVPGVQTRNEGRFHHKGKERSWERICDFTAEIGAVRKVGDQQADRSHDLHDGVVETESLDDGQTIALEEHEQGSQTSNKVESCIDHPHNGGVTDDGNVDVHSLWPIPSKPLHQYTLGMYSYKISGRMSMWGVLGMREDDRDMPVPCDECSGAHVQSSDDENLQAELDWMNETIEAKIR